MRPRLLAATVIAITGTGLAACGEAPTSTSAIEAPESPVSRIPVPWSDGGSFQLALIDEHGVVDRLVALDATVLAIASPRAEVGPQGDAVDVVWVGMPCEDTPTLEVGNPADPLLALVVHTGERHYPCAQSLVAYGVRLELSAPIQEATLTVYPGEPR